MKKDSYSPISHNQTPVAGGGGEPKSWWRNFVENAFSFLDEPAQFIDECIYKAKNIPETNYAIAQEMSDAGNYKDAILRLKIALWLAPNHEKAHYLLGCCYVSQGESAKAAKEFEKAVALDPQDTHAIFMLAVLNPSALTPQQMPVTMPLDMARNYFIDNAYDYENMQSDAGYKGHQLADAALWDMLDPRRVNYHILELGCGTGLCGTLLAQRADEIVGVDFCKEMLDIAKQKRRPDSRRVYTESLLQDIRYFMADQKQARFDAVVAAHVFNYVGDITTIFEGAAIALKAGGAFIFQVEIYNAQQGFGLVPALGRFGHSDGYIRMQCERVGLQIVECNRVRVYPDYELLQYSVRKPE